MALTPPDYLKKVISLFGGISATYGDICRFLVGLHLAQKNVLFENASSSLKS